MPIKRYEGAAETVAGIAVEEATVVVPPVTQPEPGFAWSAEEGYGDTQDWPEPEEDKDEGGVEPRSWREAWIVAIALTAVAVAAAVCVFALSALTIGDRAAITEPAPVAAPPPVAALPPASPEPTVPPPSPATVATATPPVAAPTTVTVTPAPPTTVTVEAPAPRPSYRVPPPPDADRIFREGVSGIPGIHVVNWDVAEAGARSICGGFANGMTRAQVIAEVQRNDPTFTPWQTSGLVNVALAAYCPQYEE
ncbi:DUF732 domain-containing protein [Mycobacterium sherrisii]|uniref:DUF732 domain-containing protein n=1 Tax=Mycobacterium sherrisii TaxID=243061 RepID=UPI003975D611